MRERIKSLAVGERFQLAGHGGATGSVKRHARYDYVLNDSANKERNRWGSLEQIVEDAEFFTANGVLPPADTSRW